MPPSFSRFAAAVLLAAVCLIGVSGCGPSEYRSVIYLVEHFRKNGLDGRFQKLKPDAIKAVEAGRYRGEKFDVEFARFEDPKEAEIRARKGFQGFKVYNNGHFIMLVRRRDPSVKLVKTFKSF